MKIKIQPVADSEQKFGRVVEGEGGQSCKYLEYLAREKRDLKNWCSSKFVLFFLKKPEFSMNRLEPNFDNFRGVIANVMQNSYTIVNY